MPWDPAQYRKFQSERFAPFDDLFAMIDVRPGLQVIDLGCGTGELTARLAERLPESDVVGIDSSPEMLAQARSLARPGLRFEQRSIEDVANPHVIPLPLRERVAEGRERGRRGQWDLVFSHAALQWVDDHATLIPRVLSLVAPGGRLAVQVPSNHNHESHVLIRETAAEEPFRTALRGWTRIAPVLPIDTYAEILYANGALDVTIFEKIYPHVLEDADAIAAWVKGTALVPYLDRLPDDLCEPFLTRYREKLRAQWPASPVFYPFRRILFAASRGA
jgi:trans-aconitate 2-methyltransferase